ncbi:unnamed protein product [Prorocentrum cordatum]|uniref:IBR domain-containing protein n=1 Tax=Prorocentrum cordatum TaxID=2364126 RepID=A0ABN9TIJ9_9DINO|nr:unnamed protein product [Polarella glacialis]
MDAFSLMSMCSAPSRAAEEAGGRPQDAAPRRPRPVAPRCCDMRCCCRGGTSPGEFKPPAPGERYDAVAAGWEAWEEQEEIVPREGEDEEQRQLREMLGEALGIEVRQCPFCSVACVKDNPDDCDHIHCVCGREFCWQCLADREVIFHHGNHYHRPGCPYRFDFQDQELKLHPKCPQCQRTGRIS